MAFVFRSDKKQLSRKEHSPGPGAYESTVEKQSKLPKAFVPFGSMEPKLRIFSQTNKSEVPGVGAYNVDLKSNGEKIIVSSDTEDIKILQISRPNPVFKSGTVRFKGQNEENPGPGEYEVSKSLTRNKIYSVGGGSQGTTGHSTQQRSKVIEHLINLNKYQSIPSIPSNIHAYGYNDALELNEPPVEVFKGEKGDTVGPGNYDSQKPESTKGRALAWSKPKQPKKTGEDEKVGLGPGSYEIKTMQPLYSYKPSPEFASKTLRTMDQRKGHIANKAMAAQQPTIRESRVSENPTESRVYSQKAPPSTHIGDDSSSDDDSLEYIEDTTPGPGSYEVSSTSSTVKKFYPQRQKSSSFGVSSKRFTKKPTETEHIGPGQYHQQIVPRTFKQKTIKPDKANTRFPGLLDAKSVKQPGPGAYEPRNTMEDKLIYKIQRGYRGQFGSTEARRKEDDITEEPGPGSYDPKQIVDEPVNPTNSVFKSGSVRKGITETSSTPAPGAYNINNGNIETRVVQEEEDDPDLIIKKPGFGVGEKRFKQMKKIQEEDFEDDDIIKEIQEKYREEKKRKNLKPSAAFKDKQDRFNQNAHQKVIPGPGAYYDGEEDHWNKRTYNILFADI